MNTAKQLCLKPNFDARQKLRCPKQMATAGINPEAAQQKLCGVFILFLNFINLYIFAFLPYKEERNEQEQK
ncbi:MAG: hypothetical protein LBD73_04235 [Deferribacteraceae bacterium]|nr:hypothetical protein [Deferribacteraceae bacterium]